ARNGDPQRRDRAGHVQPPPALLLQGLLPVAAGQAGGRRPRTGLRARLDGADAEGTAARHALDCTCWKPKRPLMQRFPRVTSWSSGEVTLTMSLSCTCSSRLQPTPQYGHTVSVTVCRDSSHSPACRSSCSVVNMSAPVGHTAMQLPQYTHAESGSGTASSVEMCAPIPRPATAIAKVFWWSTPQASTHLEQRMHFE